MVSMAFFYGSNDIVISDSSLFCNLNPAVK